MEIIDPVVRVVLELGVPLEQPDQRKTLSALHRAAILDQLDAFEAHSASINAQDAFGLTPLAYAVMLGNVEAARDLIQLGADVNLTDNMSTGFGPLHLACKAANPEMVQVLLDADGIDVDLQSATQGTALHLACRSQALLLVQLLVQIGKARADCEDCQGRRPLHLLALELVADGKSDEMPKMVSTLCKASTFQVDARDSLGRTALHCALLAGNKLLADLLIELKSDINGRDARGSTPLHFAACGLAVGADSGLQNSFSPLVNAGADTELRDALGFRPIDILDTLLTSRSWRKREQTALTVGKMILTRAMENKANTARAEAAARELLEAEERASPSGGKNRRGGGRRA